MQGASSRFDARQFSTKLRQIAFELRRAGTAAEPAAVHLAHRLERHAEAMLRPEGGPGYRAFALRAERLGAATPRTACPAARAEPAPRR